METISILETCIQIKWKLRGNGFTVFTMTTVTTTETTSFTRFCLHRSPMSRGHLFTISSALSSKPVATSMVNLNPRFYHRKNQIVQTLHLNTTLDQARKPPFYFLQNTGNVAFLVSLHENCGHRSRATYSPTGTVRESVVRPQ